MVPSINRRRFVVGDRVVTRRVPRRAGRIASLHRDSIGGRFAVVRFSDGGEQLQVTRDLRRIR